MKITVDMIMKCGPCKRYPLERVDELAAGRESISHGELAELDIPSYDIIWALTAIMNIGERRVYSRRVALDVIDLWDAPPVVREFLETGNESLRSDASAAARSASDAASAAARSASDAASAAAWAARSAASNAWSAAWAARASAWSTRAVDLAARSAASAAAMAARAAVGYASAASDAVKDEKLRLYISWGVEILEKRS